MYNTYIGNKDTFKRNRFFIRDTRKILGYCEFIRVDNIQCGNPIYSQKVIDFTQEKYKHPVCYNCQQILKEIPQIQVIGTEVIQHER